MLEVWLLVILFLQGYNEGDNYILTQSPLEETVVCFWRLIYDYNSSTIVMLNQIPTDQVLENNLLWIQLVYKHYAWFQFLYELLIPHN